jgi:hypothetical protein
VDELREKMVKGYARPEDGVYTEEVIQQFQMARLEASNGISSMKIGVKAWVFHHRLSSIGCLKNKGSFIPKPLGTLTMTRSWAGPGAGFLFDRAPQVSCDTMISLCPP